MFSFASDSKIIKMLRMLRVLLSCQLNKNLIEALEISFDTEFSITGKTKYAYSQNLISSRV